METYRNYLIDLVALLKEKIENTYNESSPLADFDAGQVMSLYNVLDLIKQQAHAFEIPLNELKLDTYDLEKFLKKKH